MHTSSDKKLPWPHLRPLLDRIDIHIEVSPIPYQELTSEHIGEPSSVIRDRVNKARRKQLERYSNLKQLKRRTELTKTGEYKDTQIFSNAQLGPRQIKEFCPLKKESKDLLHMVISRLGISARAYDRIIKVARTIEDLADSEDIRPEHISEAIQYLFLLKGLNERQ